MFWNGSAGVLIMEVYGDEKGQKEQEKEQQIKS